MSSPSSDLGPVLDRLAAELAALRADLQALHAENTTLRAQLEHGERARADLAAQTEHVVELLAQARRELRAKSGTPAP